MQTSFVVYTIIQRQARMEALMERHKKRCFYCNIVVRVLRKKRAPHPRDMATEDHLVPKSKGGSDLLDNLVLACNECNNQRGDMPAESFLRLKLEGRR